MAFLCEAPRRERPMLFSGPMVRALLAGRKTQTRRIVKGIDECPHGYDGVVTGTVPQESHLIGKHCFALASGESAYLQCPYGAPGDRIWVRENGWERPERTPKMMREGADTWKPYYYDADLTIADHEQFKAWGFRRRPSIHMPRWACRLRLEVTKVRVERLFALSEDDARAEGMVRVPWSKRYKGEPTHGWSSDEGQPVSETARRAFEDLWFSINGAWLDCWVWVVEFRRVP